MVIDDQPGVRRLICEALKQAGYNLCVATEGREALEKIASEAPDLVILDIKMPGMSGVEFLKELRRRSFVTPVIIITAYDELDLVEQASKYDARYFLQKPFDIQQLYRLVRGALQPGYCQVQAVGQV
ncbi:Signal transduction response regulator, receiver domain [Moorella glycerini]|uniref:Stage 0 sporulation protein A homolog n=2 Tax=Neomoorella TaxID=44260 RepID=A0A9X7J1U7_9FIRM|nr:MULTISPECIES: response regulator [Moorella]KYH33639.1 sporulation initiation phosphotransferase F [Moorella mulderi DSM 14980]MDK2816644.1 two-component system, response regulator, stage 0 sporulation protein [Moorella sp. (in: firmicutes)]PRR70038.1 Sporulation initiation phosphotransferase F [Moorella stamsii]CEP68411.1 Signal transduction response regulator, receiver domain [Moorella glycerini]